jgi:hypothetical protein
MGMDSFGLLREMVMRKTCVHINDGVRIQGDRSEDTISHFFSNESHQRALTPYVTNTDCWQFLTAAEGRRHMVCQSRGRAYESCHFGMSSALPPSMPELRDQR